MWYMLVYVQRFWTGRVGGLEGGGRTIVLRIIVGQDKMAAPIEDRITKIEFSKSYITVYKIQYDLKIEKQY